MPPSLFLGIARTGGVVRLGAECLCRAFGNFLSQWLEPKWLYIYIHMCYYFSKWLYIYIYICIHMHA